MADLRITVSGPLRALLAKGDVEGDEEGGTDKQDASTGLVRLDVAARALESLDDRAALGALRGCAIVAAPAPAPAEAPAALAAARRAAEDRAYARMLPGASPERLHSPAGRAAADTQWAADRRGIARLANMALSALGVGAAVFVAGTRAGGYPPHVCAVAAILSGALVFLAELYFALRDGAI